VRQRKERHKAERCVLHGLTRNLLARRGCCKRTGGALCAAAAELHEAERYMVSAAPCKAAGDTERSAIGAGFVAPLAAAALLVALQAAVSCANVCVQGGDGAVGGGLPRAPAGGAARSVTLSLLSCRLQGSQIAVGGGPPLVPARRAARGRG
jgi:hypothetical protein